MRKPAVPSRRAPGWKGSGARGRRVIRTALALQIAAAVLLPARPSLADGVNIARDAEAEALIQDYARPIFKAAGVRVGSVQILLVPDNNFNAFVATATNMFVTTGAIIDSETPNELIGVIAHETGHLAHGDLAGIRETIARTGTAAMIAALIGMGAAIAGSVAGVQGLGDVGAMTVAGSGQLAQRNILAYQRGQESAADRAAVQFLNATGQSPAGLLKSLQRLANQMLISSRSIDPYLQSHPLPAERVRDLENLVSKSPYADRTDPAELQKRHDLVRAKLVGFLWPPERVNRRYPLKDQSLPARYARAIAAYRHGALPQALKQIDGLIQSDPADPYFWELKGQALLESGKAKESVAPLRKAVSLAPKAGLIRILLGQALIATASQGVVDEAITTLNMGLQTDPDSPIGYRTLARAYAMKGDIAMAELATAQGDFVDGNIKDAKMHAERAQAKLKPLTPAWVRADDILSYKPPIKR